MKTKFTYILCFAIFMAIMPLTAAKYYLYSGESNPWGTREDGIVTQATDLTTIINAYATNDTVWMAAGTYTISAAIAPKAGMQIYGGFAGSESNLTGRTRSDADGNGVVEPWEFNKETIINGVGFSGTSVNYAIFSTNAAYTLNGVTLDGHNTSNVNGGAIYTNGLSFFTNCIIRNINHTGTGGGGGIWSNAYGGATVTGCLIENCVTTKYGAGIAANRKITVKQCVIRNNRTSAKGGGIFLGNTTDAINTNSIVNNAIYNNTALQGGAIFIADVTPLNIINNTIVNNYATAGNGTGGIIGIVLNQKIYNNVLYNNLEGSDVVNNLRSTLINSTLDIQYCAYNPGVSLSDGLIYGTVQNITDLSNPDFVQPSTTVGFTAPMTSDVKAANFAILATSALKDMGALPSTLSVVPAIDLMGKARPDATLCDIGAYEYHLPGLNGFASISFYENSIFVRSNSSNQITITIPSVIVGKASISIFNITGQKLENKQLTNASTVLNKSFSAGVYLVSMIVNGKTSTRKVVIN